MKILTVKKLIIPVVIATLISACASWQIPQSLLDAEKAYSVAANNPTVQKYAADKLNIANKTLLRAGAAENLEDMASLAYIGYVQVEIAISSAAAEQSKLNSKNLLQQKDSLITASINNAKRDAAQKKLLAMKRAEAIRYASSEQTEDTAVAEQENTAKIANSKQAIQQKNSISTQVSETNSQAEYIKNQQRTALVIGNGQYSYGPLKNPGNDARDVAQALTGLNFSVVLKVDVNRREMEEAIEDFSIKLSKGGVGLFYYAGHGVQLNGANYLIPIGANINKQKDVRYEAVNLGRLLDGMGEARNGLNIAILDACRNNPLPQSFRSSGDRGLVRVNSPEGTVIAFSTGPGSVAKDGEGRNGLYTQYLLKHLKTKNISIDTLLKRVSRDVKVASDRKQSPWRESSFDGEFFF